MAAREYRDRLVFRAVSLGLSVLTGIVGMFLPVLTGPQVPSAYINVFWGSAYGLGFLFAQALLGEMHPGALGFAIAMFGMFVWPSAVIFGLYRGFMHLFMRQHRWAVVGFLVLLAASLAYNVSIGSVRGTYIERMPIFSAFIDI